MNERRSRWLGRGLLIVGAGLIVWWLGVTLESRAFQDTLSRRLAAIGGTNRSSRSIFAVAARREARASGLIGRIEIPRLGISAMVIEGTDGRALRHGVGHVERTAFPGEPGNVALAAHRDTYFRDLRDVAMGDLIRVTTPDGAYAYRVDSILVVAPDRSDLLADTGDAELTLVTCYPFYWVGPAPRRFVIRARQVDAAGIATRAGVARAHAPRRASTGSSLAARSAGATPAPTPAAITIASMMISSELRDSIPGTASDSTQPR